MTTIQAPGSREPSLLPNPLPAGALCRIAVCRGTTHQPGECELFHHDFADALEALAVHSRWLTTAAVRAGTEHVDLTVVSPPPADIARLTDDELRHYGVGSI